MTADLDALKRAIRDLHGADATHVATVPVREEHNGAVVWEGEVEVFDLTGHPKASRAYAWHHDTDTGSRRFVAVLHAPPVDSPRAAVRAAVLAEVRERRRAMN